MSEKDTMNTSIPNRDRNQNGIDDAKEAWILYGYGAIIFLVVLFMFIFDKISFEGFQWGTRIALITAGLRTLFSTVDKGVRK